MHLLDVAVALWRSADVKWRALPARLRLALVRRKVSLFLVVLVDVGALQLARGLLRDLVRSVEGLVLAQVLVRSVLEVQADALRSAFGGVGRAAELVGVLSLVLHSLGEGALLQPRFAVGLNLVWWLWRGI